ncbi:hypothetical protein MMC31_000501 [Peltigera leucophlebia]|nr:hypothetical protein [Peltigera leucophlebia]
MHSFTFSAVLLSASLASGVLASANIPRALLHVRQGGDAFIPGTRQGFGATCVDAFGPNSKLCANSGTCYDASIGDSCCSEGYPCGTGSFCLVKGYCCPNTSTPAQCAAANGITLPPGFTKQATEIVTPVATTAKATTSAGASSARITTTAAAVTTSTRATSSAPFPTGSSSVRPAATGTGAQTTLASAGSTGTSTATLKPFTGAASSQKTVGGGAALALVAVAGAMGLLL